MHSIRLAGTVADHVVPHFSAGRFHCLIDLTRWYRKAFRNDLKVIDEGFHLGLHLFTVGKHDSRSVSFYRAFWHPIQRLPYDRDRFPQFLNAAHVARVDIAVLRDGHSKLEFLVARVRHIAAEIEIHTAAAQGGAAAAQS